MATKLPDKIQAPPFTTKIDDPPGFFCLGWSLWLNTLVQAINALLNGLQTLIGEAFVIGGNSFGAPAVFGTTDQQPVVFIVDGVEVARFEWNAGNPRLLVGTPSSALTTLKGSIISTDTIACVEPGDVNNMAVMDMGLGSSGTADLSSSKKGTGVLRSMAFWIFHTKVAQIDKATFGFDLLQGVYKVQGIQVVGPQQPAIPNAAGGATVDVEARAAINALLNELRSGTGHGLIAT